MRDNVTSKGLRVPSAGSMEQVPQKAEEVLALSDSQIMKGDAPIRTPVLPTSGSSEVGAWLSHTCPDLGTSGDSGGGDPAESKQPTPHRVRRLLGCRALEDAPGAAHGGPGWGLAPPTPGTAVQLTCTAQDSCSFPQAHSPMPLPLEQRPPHLLGGQRPAGQGTLTTPLGTPGLPKALPPTSRRLLCLSQPPSPLGLGMCCIPAACSPPEPPRCRASRKPSPPPSQYPRACTSSGHRARRTEVDGRTANLTRVFWAEIA